MEFFYAYYPVLIGLIPLMSLYSQNYIQVKVADYLKFYIKVMVALLVFNTLVFIGVGDVVLTAFIAIAGLLIFYNANYLYIGLFDLSQRLSLKNNFLYTISCLGLWVGLGFALIKLPMPLFLFGSVNKIFAYLSLFVFLIVCSDMISKILLVKKQQNCKKDVIEESEKRVDLPDIYHIVLDSYSGFNTLKEKGYDNDEFKQELVNRGFQVFDEVYSNYRHTTDSIPSYLNMNYLYNIYEDIKDWKEQRSSFVNIFEADLLKKLKICGYKTRFSFTQLFKTYVNPLNTPFIDEFIEVDDNKNFKMFFARFYIAYIFGTLIGCWMYKIIEKFKKAHMDTIDLEIKGWHKNAQEKGPKYLYSHILAPHQPFVCDKDGEIYLDVRKLFSKTEAQAYYEYLLHINKLTLESLDELKSKMNPNSIIIMHADHPVNINEKTNILFAVHAGDKNLKEVFPTKFTLVNAFRYILNEYKIAEVPILEDLVCNYEGKGNPLEEKPQKHDVLNFNTTY